MKKAMKMTAVLTAIAIAASMAMPVSAAIARKTPATTTNPKPTVLRLIGTSNGKLGSKANETMPAPSGARVPNSIYTDTSSTTNARVYTSYNKRIRLTVKNINVEEGTTALTVKNMLTTAVTAYDTTEKTTINGEFSVMAYNNYKFNKTEELEFAFEPDDDNLPTTKGYVKVYVDGITNGDVTLKVASLTTTDGENYVTGGLNVKMGNLLGSLASIVLAKDEDGNVLDGKFEWVGYKNSYALKNTDNNTPFAYRFIPNNSRYKTVTGRITIKW